MLDFNTLILSRNLCQHFLMFVGSLDGISSFVLHFFFNLLQHVVEVTDEELNLQLETKS